LKHLFKKQDAKQRLIRWILLLQEYDIEIKDRKGTKNVAADHLSRIENEEISNDSEVDDNFPGETLMEINTGNKPWFTDFANYLLLERINLRKERFPAGHFGKLKPRGDDPFRVLSKINDNAYKIELPGHYNIYATFNVADLSLYKGDSDDEPDSGSILFQEGEDDADAVDERVNVTNTLGAYFSTINFGGKLG
nr:reverse transcriptase domain-containing protein [Tanacetum cinerariifolium]